MLNHQILDEFLYLKMIESTYIIPQGFINVSSDDYDYYNCLKNISEYSLLHLYSQVANSDRHIPTTKRNELLVKFLKPKVKDSRWKSVKTEIKVLLKVGRSVNGNLENRLVALAEKSANHPSAATIPLYKLLVYLHKEKGIESRLYNEKEKSEAGVLYMLEDHITNCFDGVQQIAPVSLLIESPEAPQLIDEINHFGGFLAVMLEWNAELSKAHIQLNCLCHVPQNTGKREHC